ncbi:MAG TPA: STAS domain-containing protein [Rubrivivax sp.]
MALALPSTLTLPQATDTVTRLRAALTAAPASEAFAVDASALVDFDTSAIAVLLDGQRLANERGVVLQVQGAPSKLHQLAALYGVQDLLGLQGSVA